jgi:hypothetical protein
MKRECLDHYLIFNQYQLKRIGVDFVEYLQSASGPSGHQAKDSDLAQSAKASVFQPSQKQGDCYDYAQWPAS